ncbi:MAG: carbon starvation protein A [Candidatus Aureabacteria bacterium]|nr:carbon starvation protein A [Candidatus Auribacterota bacterium]
MASAVIIAGILIYVFLYHIFGGFLAKKIIKVDDSRKTPAHSHYDGVDFIPARRTVLFGHHFASIAGAAPIIGPVIALAWGWLPGLLWVWLGNIFIGAIHDYFALMASVRCRGCSIQFIAMDFFGKKTGRYVQWFVLFLLILVIAAFGAVVGKTFESSPQVASSYFFTVLAALALGVLMYRLKMEFKLATLIGIALLGLSLWLGKLFPVSLSYNTWMVILFAYIVTASALPVNVLLQPRDYLNSWLLYAGMVLGVVGGLGSLCRFTAPAVTQFAPVVLESRATPFWPIIPLIIACGSLSGFHSLVASGTSSKQLDKETDGLFIGFGSMFTEGMLSTLVIVCISSFGLMIFQEKLGASPLPGSWGRDYSSLLNHEKIGGPVSLFSLSYARMISRTLPFISEKILGIFAAIWVSSFALTTLDTTNRLGRYVISDLSSDLREKSQVFHHLVTNKWIASLIPAVLGIFLAASGKYKVIWPAFGAANQLLASIALITGTLWVIKASRIKRSAWIFIPSVFLWVTVTCALAWFIVFVLPGYIRENILTGIILAVISVAMMVINLLLSKSFYLKSSNE